MQKETDRIMRPTEVAVRLGVSVPTVYRLAQRGALPRPLRVSSNVSGWKESEIVGFMDSRPRTRAERS